MVLEAGLPLVCMGAYIALLCGDSTQTILILQILCKNSWAHVRSKDRWVKNFKSPSARRGCNAQTLRKLLVLKQYQFLCFFKFLKATFYTANIRSSDGVLFTHSTQQAFEKLRHSDLVSPAKLNHIFKPSAQ